MQFSRDSCSQPQEVKVRNISNLIACFLLTLNSHWERAQHKNQLPKMACAMCHAQRAAKTSFAAAMVLSMSSSVCAKEVKPASYCEGAK